ncbi:benzylsuccinate CoA-transferase BbsE subunit [Mesorhizobium sp. J18]|uniref:CaiB/BaiF CoA transferase family protein n=1 Tax=Mesorhizobium sp. J18 TaxID=935263 RepID=UPI0011999B1D|nr:CoA transferase [Mesorhizobium sp. J18]TWG90164.1 benzylsuccinate CoA-transferase BbsE subunit [Mesorhizobium sp. J18]
MAALRKPKQPQPYDGMRILDLTHRYGVYAGKLFADLGAEVIRVEPPDGLPDRAALPNRDPRFAFLNANKKSIVLDFGDPRAEARIDALVSSAGAVFIERDGPLYDAIGRLRAANPRAVITAVSPYGMTGPLADAPASDLVLQAAGGIAWMSGRIEREPLALPFSQATMVGSIYAATVTAIALHHAEATGQGHLIDVSVQECIAHSLQNAIQVWDLEQRISIRGGEGTRDATEDIFPCRDGFVFLASPLAVGNSWKSLVAWMVEAGHPSGKIFSHERWSSREWRLTREAREEFRTAFTAFSTLFDKEEMARQAIARRIVMGPASRISEVIDDPQLAHRDFFTQVEMEDGALVRFPGAPFKLTPQVWATARAPALGEHNASVKELSS